MVVSSNIQGNLRPRSLLGGSGEQRRKRCNCLETYNKLARKQKSRGHPNCFTYISLQSCHYFCYLALLFHLYHGMKKWCICRHKDNRMCHLPNFCMSGKEARPAKHGEQLEHGQISTYSKCAPIASFWNRIHRAWATIHIGPFVPWPIMWWGAFFFSPTIFNPSRKIKLHSRCT